jgi:hypothetical protein
MVLTASGVTAGVGPGLGTTVNIAWSLSERSLGDAEYLAAMRTLVLPLIKVGQAGHPSC